MVHPGFLVYAGMGLVAGPFWFLHGFRAFRRKRLIENTPTARIHSMAMGLVEVNGTVTSRSTTLAPFSGRPCALWQVDVALRSGKRGWRVVHRNQSGNPFFLEDETGVALVYPQGAESRVNFQLEEVCSGLSLPDCYTQYLREHAPHLRAAWGLENLRFRERLIEDGQQVYVLGTATPRSRATTISEGEAMQATGTDGIWSHRTGGRDERVVATIRRGSNETTFLISQASERELTFMLGLQSLGGLVGGPLVTVVGLALWLDQLGRFRWGS